MSNSIIQSYYKRNDLNHIEELIMRVTNYAWSEMTLSEQGELRETAAAELAAMQARIEKLEAVRKAAQSHMDFHGKPKGISKTNDDLLDALAECDK